jgi:hypothetical protein
MESTFTAAWLSDVAEPLTAKFGCDLTLCRAGNRVRWGFAGQSALVEFLPDGSLTATFVDRVSIDHVTNEPAFAAYSVCGTYRLTTAGCSHMIADMVDFFSGVREPKFTFAGAVPR